MAFIAPLFLLLAFATVDVGRAVYSLSRVSASARAAARTLTLPTQANTDCAALAAALSAGNGIRVLPDPASLGGDPDPDAGASGGPSSASLSPGQGYVYLFPAVSRVPPAGGSQTSLDPSGVPYCDNSLGGSGRHTATVKARVTYRYQPLTPVISHLVPTITLQSESVQSTEVR